MAKAQQRTITSFFASQASSESSQMSPIQSVDGSETDSHDDLEPSRDMDSSEQPPKRPRLGHDDHRRCSSFDYFWRQKHPWLLYNQIRRRVVCFVSSVLSTI